MEYTTRGTCSRLIKFDVDGDKVKDVLWVVTETHRAWQS